MKITVKHDGMKANFQRLAKVFKLFLLSLCYFTHSYNYISTFFSLGVLSFP